jgi:MFS family permease
MARSWLAPEWQLIAYLWVCYLLNHADRQVVYTLFPLLQKEFGYSDAVVGLTGALFLWVYGLCSPVAGILGDRFSTGPLGAQGPVCLDGAREHPRSGAVLAGRQ